MKLTKADIRQKQAELVSVLLRIEKLKGEKSALEKALDRDFEENEAKYRAGVKTDNGILVRKPTWKNVAKPIVEVA